MLNTFTLAFKVRDYECDSQARVNNSIYQNYLEHTRHEYLLSLGHNFIDFKHQNINLVVVRAELDYKLPLCSGDLFVVSLTVRRLSKLKIEFRQNIYLTQNNKIVLEARISVTSVNEKGRPYLPDVIDKLFPYNN